MIECCEAAPHFIVSGNGRSDAGDLIENEKKNSKKVLF